jgi:hypothetical protein
MKGDSIPAGHGADAFPAIRPQNHATLQLRENRSVARSVASPETENYQNRGKTTANTSVSALFQPKTAPEWAELEGRYTSISLDTRSVASNCSVEVPRYYHAAVEAGARAADDDT